MPRVPHDVNAILKKLAAFLDSQDEDGREPCNAKCGVYVFYDYDGEPIYVGQTNEKLRTRIRRHLTNQRTDAVAMNVLDPYEVAEVEVYPFYELERRRDDETAESYRDRVKTRLAAAEYTVFQRVLALSELNAVLNEGDIPERPILALPRPVRGRIVPGELYETRKHADVRIARRAGTIARLAKVISERDVSTGLRRTLLTQARRLERLARRRLEELTDDRAVESDMER